jgi:NADH-quinone oxidoreductase subunit G
MCDIGRFEYHWIEGDDRVRKPLERDENGALQPVTWHEANSKLRDRIGAAGSANPDGVRFLLSAHASHEELFLFRRLAEELIGDTKVVSVCWRTRAKPQPANAKFKVPSVDAPNVNGARIFGFVPGAVGADAGECDISALRADVEAGRVSALYVFDPGPEGSLGDVEWIADARRRGALPLLIVQGVLLTDLARSADFVLPGASYVEKEASYTNEQGRLQGTARAIAPPGDAVEDWQILVNLATTLGVRFDYTAAAHIRADIAARFGEVPGLEGLTGLAFARPLSARHWLQASNPSERWKWDFMFQDLPPVKGDLDPTALPVAPGTIALREVK